MGGGHSGVLIVVLVFGILFSLLYYSGTATTKATTTDFTEIPLPALSQEQAIEIADNDLKAHLEEEGEDYANGISAIILNSTSGYVPIDEIMSRDLRLPLVYISSGGELVTVKISNNGTDNSYETLGKCDSGFFAYCGFLPPYNFDYGDRLVYGVQVLAGRGFPYLYIVDAEDGTIIDSSFQRMAVNRVSNQE